LIIVAEFLTVCASADALEKLFELLPGPPPSEVIPSASALDRVTAAAVLAPAALPAFVRSTVDGYAVLARDTFGANATLPAYLRLAGEINMGEHAPEPLLPGQAILIHTGGMLPVGADAVVMVENTQLSRPDEVEVLRPVAAGENLVNPGDDINRGEIVLPAGQRLRPQDIGGLLALGITTVCVARTPVVGLISSGDELTPPTVTPAPGKVRDINSYTVGALAARAGAAVRSYGLLPDDYGLLLQTAQRALQECDVLVFSAGSSAGTRDVTSGVINALGSPGVIVHGIAVKPGKPTILGVALGKPVFGLPGNPGSALVVADLVLVPTLFHLQGASAPPPRLLQARLTHNLASSAGREDYVPGRFVEREGERWVEPLFGKSNLIFTLVKADGAILIPLHATGLAAGQIVDVRLF
jgi:molybdopterin molybdotransferase